MSQALVQVGVQVVGEVAILVDEVDGRLVDDKFISESIALRRLIVSIGQIADGNALRAMFLSDIPLHLAWQRK